MLLMFLGPCLSPSWSVEGIHFVVSSWVVVAPVKAIAASIQVGRVCVTQDPNSHSMQRIRQELGELSGCEGLEMVEFLENVASMPPPVQSQCTEWLGSAPILVDASKCGWVQRRRLTVNGIGVSPSCQPPDDWQWEVSQDKQAELRYCGSKPVPAKVHFEGKFRPLFDPAEIVKMQGKGAMHTFTREFFHPDDRTKEAEPEAVQRFYEDSRRFPPSAYSSNNLVWDQSTWRQPSPQERLQMMGFPAATLASVQGPTPVKCQRQNSIVGNGFHIPMIVALFCLMPSLLQAKLVQQPVGYTELGLRERVAGTIWEPGRLRSFPGLWDAPQIIHDMQHMLSDFPVHDSVWQEVRTGLQHIDVQQLQGFSAWALGKGLGPEEWGPNPLHRRHRVEVYAGITGQRYPGTSAKGLDHLLKPGLGKEEHIRQALEVASPFQLKPWPEGDVEFVLYSVCIWQEFLSAFAASQRRKLMTVARALKPLGNALDRYRGEAAKLVASAKRPAFLAFLTSLLRWPDRAQPGHFIQGYPIVGDIAPSGVFRSVTSKSELNEKDWLGEAADLAVRRIESSKPPRFHEEILELTKAEQSKNFCSSFVSKQELDRRFGVGGWRPLERFMIVQPCGKKRIIDNARKTLHNAATNMHETIWTINVDFIAACIKQLAARMKFDDPAEWTAAHPWLHFRLGNGWSSGCLSRLGSPRLPSTLLRGGRLDPGWGLAILCYVWPSLWPRVSSGGI